MVKKNRKVIFFEVELRANAASSVSWAKPLSSRLPASEVGTSDIGS